MNYVLTRHARDVLVKRQIALEWLERVLFYPEQVEDDAVDADLEHRLAPIPEFGNRTLRVIVDRRKQPPHVVTAFFDRRRKL